MEAGISKVEQKAFSKDFVRYSEAAFGEVIGCISLIKFRFGRWEGKKARSLC